ncbi:BnaCnng49950D [Brassica napus]|uniref:BnaCnng49950D protein n=1 Tax=Brassica napus TaxID=3708 RepID=A0A078JK62_BRANA|nr:BnaCnng49950D [Brassica napus]
MGNQEESRMVRISDEVAKLSNKSNDVFEFLLTGLSCLEICGIIEMPKAVNMVK